MARSLLCLLAFLAAPLSAQVRIGAAQVDVTPDEPIRLSGYGSRRAPHVGVSQRLWAKALAIAGGDEAPPAVLIAVDNCGVPWHVTQAVAHALERRAGVPRERVTVSSTHTHSAPMVRGVLENLFSAPLTAEERAAIDRYTTRLTDALTDVALEALRALAPARLRTARGSVDFAANRRRVDAGRYAGFGVDVHGPVDHDVPVLFAEDEAGNVRCVVASYACHCTTLGGDFEAVCGDWAGFAAEALAERWPGAPALILIGCGADQNPEPRGTLALAERHGRSLAAEVFALRANARPLAPVAPVCALRTIDLPFEEPPARAVFEERARQPGIVGYHARRQLERLANGEGLPRTLPYPIQVWSFADELVMVFLAGEVVVDYALAIHTAFDRARTWVSAYTNDVPCYIPSRRILREGGYEAEGSLLYYDRPTRLAPAVEQRILDTVEELVPAGFRVPNGRTAGIGPTEPEASLELLELDERFRVELVASEPLVDDPIAIDWDLAGNLWVLEMRDYPQGLSGGYEPGGRVVVLSDADGDGRYETRRTFLDGLPFPTGLHVWNGGLLVCAAPDVLFARDVDGDGVADETQVIFTGFDVSNYQARVNGFQLGLDHWLHGSSGLFGGEVGTPDASARFALRGRDFRMRASPWRLEPVTGLSQHGRVRDDWGAWFGNDNGHLLWHFPMDAQDLRRNPHVASPPARVLVPRDPDPFLVHPRVPRLERYNHPEAWNRVTAACAPAIYRDLHLGADLAGDAFVCEPAHGIVTRRVLDRSGIAITGRRAAEEREREFLASPDPWFRPVQVRTGPDGALWVVDLYRFLLEHPRWIPPQRLAEIDERAGAGRGRIYRIVPRGDPDVSRPRRARAGLDLARSLDDSNGTWRDLVHAELLRTGGPAEREALLAIARTSRWPAARLQAWCVADALEPLAVDHLAQALADPEPEARRGVLRLARRGLEARPERAALVLALPDDEHPGIRHELALALGAIPGADAGERLARLLRAHGTDAWMRAALLCSAERHGRALLAACAVREELRAAWIDDLVASALGFEGQDAVVPVLNVLLATDAAVGPTADDDRARAAATFEVLVRHGADLPQAWTAIRRGGGALFERLHALREGARAVLQEDDAAAERLGPALRIVAGLAEDAQRDQALWLAFLEPRHPASCRTVALDALLGSRAPGVPDALLARWPLLTPGARSRIVDGLLARPDGVDALTRAVVGGRIEARWFDAPQRERIAQRVDEATRAALAAAFAADAPVAPPERRFDPQALTALSGRLDDGRRIFAERCASCHRFRGQGRAVGPDLAALTDRSAAFLLAEIEDPSARVLAPYVAYAVETHDGELATGMIAEEGETSLRLVQGDGVERTFLRREILAVRSLGSSAMPTGLVADLGEAQMKALLVWLASAPAPFGAATEEQAREARRAFRERRPNGLVQILGSAESLAYPSWLGRLPLHVCRQTDGTSRLTWEGSLPEDAPRADGRALFVLPAAMGFRSQPDGRFTLAVGDARVAFSVTLEDAVFASEDGRLQLEYFVRERNAEDGCGELTVAVDPSLLEPGRPVRFEVVGSASGSQRWFGVYALEAR